MAKYYSTKTYGNDRGLSCVFRQPRATHSHCSLLHGYSLGFKFIFECDTLDDKNWCFDFGGCKFIKQYLEDTFDHTWALDTNDPFYYDCIKFAEATQTAKIVQLDGVGCEKFAEHVYNFVSPKVTNMTEGRVRLKSVECFEHGANSAIYEG